MKGPLTFLGADQSNLGLEWTKYHGGIQASWSGSNGGCLAWALRATRVTHFHFARQFQQIQPRPEFTSRFVKGKDSVFREVADSWFRFEQKGRGSLHLHLLLWLKKEPVDVKPEGSQDSANSDNDRSHTEQRCVVSYVLGLGYCLGCFPRAFLAPPTRTPRFDTWVALPYTLPLATLVGRGRYAKHKKAFALARMPRGTHPIVQRLHQ